MRVAELLDRYCSPMGAHPVRRDPDRGATIYPGFVRTTVCADGCAFAEEVAAADGPLRLEADAVQPDGPLVFVSAAEHAIVTFRAGHLRVELYDDAGAFAEAYKAALRAAASVPVLTVAFTSPRALLPVEGPR